MAGATLPNALEYIDYFSDKLIDRYPYMLNVCKNTIIQNNIIDNQNVIGSMWT
jgi:hypothetical protein